MSKRSAGEPVQQDKSKRQRRPNEIAIKFLLPDVVVGALLSKKAAALKRIREQTGHYKDFILKLSAKGQFYPGTRDERMVALAGPPQLVHRACCLLQDQIIDDPYLVTDESGTNAAGPRQGQMKLIVSDRAASKIIGSRGSVVKDISRHFNIVIAITQSKDIIVPNERLVTVIGPSRNVFDSLEPIIYQISQQEAHVETEFEYYEQYNNPKPAEAPVQNGGEESSTETPEPGTDASVVGESDGSKPVDEGAPDDGKKEECEKEDTAEEIKQSEKKEGEAKEEENDGTKGEENDSAKAQGNDDAKEVGKDQEKANEKSEEKESVKEDRSEGEKKKWDGGKKDGRWVWQTDSVGKPLWVWVESKNSGPGPYSNRTRGW